MTCGRRIVLMLALIALSAGAAETQHVARLKYVSGCFGYWDSTELGDREVVFKDEPDFDGLVVMRGCLPCAEEKDEVIPFAFVRDALPTDAEAHRKSEAMRFEEMRGAATLLLDLNGNWDLTDDPDGLFCWGGDFASSGPVRFTRIQNGVPVPYSATIYCNTWTSGTGEVQELVMMVREQGWAGTVDLAGKRWSLAVVNDLDGIHDSDDLFILKPYVEEDWGGPHGTVPPTFDRDELLCFPLPGRLDLEGTQYTVAYGFEKTGDTVEQIVTFTETRFPTGEAVITSTHVSHLMLFGADKRDTLVTVARNPGAAISVPAGTYGKQRIYLDNGKENGVYRAEVEQSLVVTEGKRTAVHLGTPLTPQVTAEPAGRDLVLQFVLAGAAGENYTRLQGADNAPDSLPGFVTTHKGAEVVAGKFRYG